MMRQLNELGMPTTINTWPIALVVEDADGWWHGIVHRPDGPFADKGREYVVFKNWDGVSDHWGSGIYDLTATQAENHLRRMMGMQEKAE